MPQKEILKKIIEWKQIEDYFRQASIRYEGELKGASDKNELDSLIEARRKFSIYRKITFITFLLGIVVGVTFGVLCFHKKYFMKPNKTSNMIRDN